MRPLGLTAMLKRLRHYRGAPSTALLLQGVAWRLRQLINLQIKCCLVFWTLKDRRQQAGQGPGGGGAALLQSA